MLCKRSKTKGPAILTIMWTFAISTLIPVVLLALTAFLGGVWGGAALVYITVFTAAVDRFGAHLARDLPDGAEFPTGGRLSVALGVAHFAILALALTAFYGPVFGHVAGFGEKIILLLGVALFFGQVSHPNAHELIHRREKYARNLGRLIYVSMLFGHHASAHVLVHHVHVASARDPNSAQRGVGFYRFFARAWIGSFVAGWRAENMLRARATHIKSPLSHPYLGYVGGACAFLLGSYLYAGLPGLIGFFIIAFYAQVQVLIADYVQHYGLRRALRDTGKPVPVGPQHSWNSPHWFSSALMLNAPRHSDHHLHPNRPYPALQITPETMPIMPHSLPVMAVVALIPPLWRSMMARELKSLPMPPSSS